MKNHYITEVITINETRSLYTHLICSKSGRKYSKKALHTYSELHKPLLAKYDLSEGLVRDFSGDRPNSMWRYRELLPIENDENIVSLGEGLTPITLLEKAGNRMGLPQLYLKDEALNPTGSFKARGLSMAISKAKELGVRKCIVPTAGNAGGAMSAYCAKAGIEAQVFMPVATPQIFSKECEYFGAKVTLVNGTIRDCAMQIAQIREPDWFDISTLKEPFRLEGKKTMGFEIAEQFNWQLPDVIFYPTGGGTGLIGIWKAFDELEELGWIGPERPRMVAVQTEACYPIVKAFREGKLHAESFQNPSETIANGLRVPAAFADELILQVLYESNGTALTVSDQAILQSIQEVAQQEGVLLSPEGAATLAALKQLNAEKWICPNEQILVINTGSGYKYMENL